MSGLARGIEKKWISLCILAAVFKAIPAAIAVRDDPEILITVSQAREGFEIRASYRSPLNQCQAYALLTDFSSNEPTEGIKSSKVIRLSQNTTRVEQVIEDRVLFFPIRFDSVIDYTEYPVSGMDLKQVKGYFKDYQAKWLLSPTEGGTVFSYEAFILPDSIIPRFVVEHFMSSRIHARFEKMALRAKSRVSLTPERCQ